MVPLKPKPNRQNRIKRLFSKDIYKLSLFIYVLIVLTGTFTYHIDSQASTNQIQVNSTADDALAGGASVCDTDLTDGETVTCTLRAAIEFANSNANNGTVDEIVFTGLTGTGANTEINISSSLPTITEQLYIDGTDGDGDTLDVVIEGGDASNVDAFLFSGNDAHGSKIENLVIRGFDNYDIKVLNSERQNGTTYIFNNNYIGVNRDGSSIYTRSPQYYSTEYGIQVDNSNYVTVQNSTITQEKAKLIYLHDSSYVTIESSKLGVAADESLIAGDLSSFWAIHNDSSENVTIHNNFIGGGYSTSYELVHLEHANNQTFTDNMVCINSANANTCNDTDGLLIEGKSNPLTYVSGITITGNQFDGEDDIDDTSGLRRALIMYFVDNPNADDPALTNKFYDNKLGTVNPLRSSSSYLLYLYYVTDTVFEKGTTGEFGTANNAIYINYSNGNTFKDFDITWEINPTPNSHYNNSGLSLAASSYDNLIQNISIQGYDYGVYTSAASVDFNQFDRLLVKTHSNQQNNSGSFSQMPFTSHQGGFQSGTPTINSTSESGGTYSINLDVSANINGDSCFFTFYISDTEDLADAFLSDSSGVYNIAGTVNSGVCSVTNKEMIIPAEYTPVFANYVSAIVTEEYASANLDDGTAVSDVKQSSTYSTAAVADLNVPIVVNSTGDEALANGAVNCDTDLTDGATQTCTLRAAIELANTAATTNQIKLSGITGAGTQTILVGSNLPDITKPVSIDGHDANGNKVGINGQNSTSEGLSILNDDAAPSTIENVSIYNFTSFNLNIGSSDSDSFANAHDIKNSYFGFEPDGTTIQSSNGDAQSTFADYVKFDNIVSTYLTCTYSEKCQITNSKLGTDKNASDISSSSVSPLGLREYSNTIYTDNNNVIGGTGAAYAGANKPTTSTISNNYYCVNSNGDELCRDTGSAVNIVLDSQKISVDFTNNVIDGGTEAESPTHGLDIDGQGTSSNTPALTIDNCDIGLVNGFHVEASSSAIHIYEDVSGLQITNTDIGAARYAGIEFSTSTHENVVISNVTITGDSSYSFSEYERGIKLAHSRNSTFSNVSISNYYYGLDPNNSTSYNWQDFDNVRIFDVNTAFRDPASYFDSTASQPVINSANSDQVNVDLSATVSEMDHDGIAGNDYASSCYFQVYIADTDVQGQAILTGATDNIDIPGTLNTGVSPPTCTATNVTLDIPDSYTFGANNYLVATVTEIIPTINWVYNNNSPARTASNVEQSSPYSAGTQMDLTSSASIALDDGDGYSQIDTTGNGVADTDDVMFPYTTTVTLDASGSENAASYAWDLDTSVDSDLDGTPDNDTDATTESVTVNYGTSLINGAAAQQTLTNDMPVTVKLTVTGVSGDSATSSLQLKPMNPTITGGIPSCTAPSEGIFYNASLMDMSSVAPVSLYWDFDTLTDAADDGNNATNWDGDGDTDNDIQATVNNPADQPYGIGNYRIGLFHFDKPNQQGQSISKFHDLEVVNQVVSPDADFDYSKNELEVSFTDTSTGGCMTSWAWDFDTATDSSGDENTSNDVDSTEQNPTHTYSSSGTYTVKLTATNNVGTSTITETVAVTDTAPTANFSTDTTNITTGDTVAFTNTSTGDLISGFSWDFDNDGTEDSTLQNPTYAYAGVAGVITASLTVTNPAGSDTHTVNINVSPKAEFTLDDGSGNAALEFDGTADPALPNEGLIVPQSQVVTLNVANAVAGVIYTWDLNGSVDSDGDTSATNDSDATGQTVTIDYSTGTVNGVVKNDLANGTGDITIKLFASSGGLETSQSATIRILKAAGSVSSTCIAKNSQITFSNTSTGFESSTYNFGDGNTKTFEENTSLSHTNTYANAGNFTAQLTVFDNSTADGQSQSVSHNIEVLESIGSPVPSFSYSKNLLEVSFTDTSTGGCITGWEWDFDNDGVADSTAQNPVHTYPSSGVYMVKLTAINSSGSVQSSGINVIVANNPPTADFTPSQTNITQGDTVTFTSSNEADSNTYSYSWDFDTGTDSSGDGNTSNDQESTDSDPSHTFSSAAGTITVQMTATNPAGSDTHTVDINVAPKADFSVNDGSGNAVLEFDGTDDPTLPNEGLIVPQTQDLTLAILNPVTGATYNWDLNTAIDSDVDADVLTDNDVDAVGQSITVNYATGAVNGVVNSALTDGTGDITIKLTASSAGGSNTQESTIRILKASGNVSASCIAKNTQITFNNTSSGFASSLYDFGDGNTKVFNESTTLSHVNTYTTPGNFTAVLSVFDNAAGDGQSATNSHAIEVVAEIVEPTAQATYVKFTPDPADDYHAQFNDSSIGGCIESWEWDFNNDGISDSLLQNPTFDFENLGTYPVSLTVTNSAGVDTLNFDVVITDQGPVASFTENTTEGQAPLEVSFVNTSTGDGISYEWDYNNDGIVDSTEASPQKTFNNPGIFTVSLKVTNYQGSSTTNQEIQVNPKSTFTITPDSGTVSTDFTFEADFDDTANYNYAWDIDSDGSNDGSTNPDTLNYSSSGSKTAKLTVTSKANPALTSFSTLPFSVSSSGGNNNSSNNYSAPTTSNNSASDSGASDSASDSGTDSASDSGTESTSDQSSQDTPATDISSEVAPPADITVITIPDLAPAVIEPVFIAPTPEPEVETPAVEPEATPEAEDPEAEEPETEAPEAEEPEAPAEAQEPEQTEEPEAETPAEDQEPEEGILDNLAELFTGALFADIEAPELDSQEQAVEQDQEPEIVALPVQTEVIKVQDEVVEKALDEVFAKKPEVKLTNQEKQTQVLAKQEVSEKKKNIASKVVVDTVKQKEIVTKVVEKVRQKQEQQQAEQQEVVKTIQAQDEDNNGVSDAIQELIGLSNEEIKIQQEEDPNLLAPRAIFLNPENAAADIMLEMRESETYPDDNFIANGIVDTPDAQAGDIVEFYAQKDGEKLLIGASQLDENKNFSYINRSELEAGQYDIVAKLKSEDNTQSTEFSVPIEVTIDPQAPQIPVTLDGFAGQSQELLQSSANTAFAGSHDIISGVVLERGQPVSLALNVDSELARVVVNFNSVLYSATAITSSTNSEIQVDAPLELAFEPGTSHTATAFAESIEDPTIKSKPIIIEFAIAKPAPWYQSTYALLAMILLALAGGLYFYQSQRQSA